jgi:hypothetical protein
MEEEKEDDDADRLKEDSQSEDLLWVGVDEGQ